MAHSWRDITARISAAAQTRLLGISDEEVTLARRGFRAKSDTARGHLETVGQSFLGGYHAALHECDADNLGSQLAKTQSVYRGFAFEGAAMALALLDHLPLGWRSRWSRFLTGPGSSHRYMLHVGYGWAAARLPWLRRNLHRLLAQHDPLLRWLIVDGYGFHEGYFYARRYVEEQSRPRRLSEYALRAFDQGLGRSLWFMSGADHEQLPALVAHFPDHRRADLWSGIGLACTYAGILDADGRKTVSETAGQYREHLAQGAAFAAKARQLAGNPAEHTDLACREFCRMDAVAAAQVTDDELCDLPADREDAPAFEVWRTRIRQRLTRAGTLECNMCASQS